MGSSSGANILVLYIAPAFEMPQQYLKILRTQMRKIEDEKRFSYTYSY